jgi:hypothetical protein
MKAAHLGYAALILGGRRIGRYSESQTRQGLNIIATAMAQRYGGQVDMHPFIAILPRLTLCEAGAENQFVEIWHNYLRQHDFLS